MNTEIITLVDGFLKELGTAGMVDGDKARNQLLDIRSALLSLMTEVPDTPAELVADPALFTEIITGI